MIIKDKYLRLVNTISKIYDEREANNIVSIIFEDAFGVDKLSGELFPSEYDHLFALIEKRLLQNEPFQYILEEADFYGLKFKVNKSVLIPRQETEELVYFVENAVSKNEKMKILDIGTGSGCIAISLAKELVNAKVYGVDVSKEALVLAKKNAILNDVDVAFQIIDILDDDSLDKIQEFGPFDVIVSNPPYIPHYEASLMRSNVLDFEPKLALFVENDNTLIFYKRISKLGTSQLKNQGILAFEINEFLGDDVRNILLSYGYKNVEIIKDMQQKDRIVKGVWNG